MANDWLFEVGVDTTKADADLKKFVSNSTNSLNALTNVKLTMDTRSARASLQNFINFAKSAGNLPSLNLQINVSGATSAFKSFMKSVTANQGALSQLTATFTAMDAVMNRQIGVLTAQADAFKNLAAAMTQANLASRGIAASAKTMASSSTQSVNALNNMNRQTRMSGDSVTWLGKVLGNTVFKFIEYQIIMEAFTGAMAEFGSALHQAGDVQVEQVLQKLYGGFVNVNSVLQDAMVLAKHYGDNIQDVQQAIGIWSKVTKDQATAEFLANQALKLHTASGIATNDVTLTTISLMSKLNLTAGDIPKIYDQITLAAEKMSLPLKNLGTTSGKQEGIREILEGLTESSAMLKAQGLDTASSIALVATAIQNMGESGKQAGAKLSQLFAGFELAKSGKAFDAIFEASKIRENKSFLDQIVGDPKKVEKLLGDIKDGIIHTRPQVLEALMGLIAASPLEQHWANELRTASKGALDTAANTMLQTWPVILQKTQASLQAFTIVLGTILLPQAEKVMNFLANDMFPWLQKNADEFVRIGKTALEFAAALVGLNILGRIGGLLEAIRDKGIAAAFGFNAATTGARSLTSALLGPAGVIAALGMLATAWWEARSQAQLFANAAGNGMAMKVQVLQDTRQSIMNKYKQVDWSPNGGIISYKDLSDVDARHVQQLNAQIATAQKQLAANGAPNTMADLEADIAAGAKLYDHFMKGQKVELPSSGIATTNKDIVSPTSQVISQMANLHRAQMADMSSAREDQATAQTQIDDQKALAQAYGWSAKSIQQLSQAYQSKIAATQAEENIAKSEIASNMVMVVQLERKRSAYASNTNEFKAYTKAISQLNADTEKAIAHTEHLAATTQLLATEKHNAVMAAVLESRAMADGTKNIEEQITAVEKLARAHADLSGKYTGANAGIATLTPKLAAAQADLAFAQQHGAGQDNIAKKQREVDALTAAIAALGVEATDSAKALGDLAKSLFDKADALSKSMFDIASAATNVSAADLAYTNSLYDSTKKLNDLDQEILDAKTKIGSTDEAIANAAKANLDSLTRERDLYRDIAPMIAQIRQNEELIRQTRSSTGYTAALSAVDTGVNALFAKGIADLFHTNQSTTVLASSSFKNQWPFQTSGKSWGSLMGADFMAQVVKSWSQNITKSFLDFVTGVNKKESDTQAMGRFIGQHVQSIQLFGTYVDNFTSGVNSFGSGNSQDGINLSNQAQKKMSQAVDDGIYNSADSTALNAGMAALPSILGQTTDLTSLLTKAAITSSSGSGVAGSGGIGGLSGILSVLGGGNVIGGGIAAVGGLTALLGRGDSRQSQISGGIGALVGGGVGAGIMALLGSGMGGFAAMGALGPIGIALGVILGAAAGGLFSHKTNPATSPDIYDTSNYGQFVSNLNGVAGNFNGQVINPASQYDASVGGIPEATSIYNWLNDVNGQGLSPSKYSQLSSSAKAAINEARSLGHLGIASESQGVFTLQSGAKIGVTQYEQLIATLQAIEGNTGKTAASLAPLLTISVFGASAGTSVSPYNTPGMNSAELKALQKNQGLGLQGFRPTYYTNSGGSSGTPPGYHLPGPVGLGGNHPINITTQLMLDGALLAEVVNSYNNAAAVRQGV